MRHFHSGVAIILKNLRRFVGDMLSKMKMSLGLRWCCNSKGTGISIWHILFLCSRQFYTLYSEQMYKTTPQTKKQHTQNTVSDYLSDLCHDCTSRSIYFLSQHKTDCTFAVNLCEIRAWSISASGAGAYHGIMEQMRGFLAFATHCSIKSAGNDKQVLDFRFQLPFKSVYFM